MPNVDTDASPSIRPPLPPPGPVPLAVVMITLNEGHNMEAALSQLAGWAQEVLVVDSLSADDTVDIALRHGARVVQRPFKGFGDQWNFALSLPVSAPWTMKLDPDERLTDDLRHSIAAALAAGTAEGYAFDRRLWFMGRTLPVKQEITRVWRSGACRFSDVTVNEHPIVSGRVEKITGDLEHHDSPDLHHWLDKQNRYTTAEAIASARNSALAAEPKLFGTAIERRMWIKANYRRFPFRYAAITLYHLIVDQAWRAGWVGLAWARLRGDVYRLWDYKLKEIRLTGRLPSPTPPRTGTPDPRVRQYD